KKTRGYRRRWRGRRGCCRRGCRGRRWWRRGSRFRCRRRHRCRGSYGDGFVAIGEHRRQRNRTIHRELRDAGVLAIVGARDGGVSGLHIVRAGIDQWLTAKNQPQSSWLCCHHRVHWRGKRKHQLRRRAFLHFLVEVNRHIAEQQAQGTLAKLAGESDEHRKHAAEIMQRHVSAAVLHVKISGELEVLSANLALIFSILEFGIDFAAAGG